MTQVISETIDTLEQEIASLTVLRNEKALIARSLDSQVSEKSKRELLLLEAEGNKQAGKKYAEIESKERERLKALATVEAIQDKIQEREDELAKARGMEVEQQENELVTQLDTVGRELDELMETVRTNLANWLSLQSKIYTSKSSRGKSPGRIPKHRATDCVASYLKGLIVMDGPSYDARFASGSKLPVDSL